MKINDFNLEEKIAFVGLLEMMLMADQQLTDPEVEYLQDVINEFGVNEYKSIVERRKDWFADDDKFRDNLEKVTNQEVRELIFSKLFLAAAADYIDRSESDLLQWLIDKWNLKPFIIERKSKEEE